MSNALAIAMQKPVKLPNLPSGFMVTPIMRVSFPHLDAPWAGDNPQAQAAYQVLGIFSDDADISSLRAAENRFLVQKFGPGAPQQVQFGMYKMPIHPKLKMSARYSGFEGDGYYATFRAKPTAPPACIDASRGKPILLQRGAIERVIYPGCYCYATFQPYNFDKGGGKGVSFGLKTLVKVADGDNLGGPREATREEVLGSVVGLNLPGLIVHDGTPVLLESSAQADAVAGNTPPWDPNADELEDVEQF